MKNKKKNSKEIVLLKFNKWQIYIHIYMTLFDKRVALSLFLFLFSVEFRNNNLRRKKLIQLLKKKINFCEEDKGRLLVQFEWIFRFIFRIEILILKVKIYKFNNYSLPNGLMICITKEQQKENSSRLGS